ncbi:hypothetical protein BOX15_Mlig014385g2 [Macrostomum lignano]|uniref:non-specific protein-tyrosine kinase n=1 Tax=Macrostomum lignano TaxID=282301 RepID=A0A267EAJ7_9PLAT|nr:hypothetical protein BOX15_Mlig014385g2 [Macrostomum lignano]
MPGAGAGNGHLEGSRKCSSDQDLYAFLADCELEHYYTAMVHSLKVTGVAQLKYVEDPDLASIGLTNPEMRRLRKQFRLRCPQSAVDRLRLRLARARGLQPRQRPSATPEAEFSRVSSRNSRLIPRYQLQLGRQIGEGDFARVHQAVWRPSGDRGLWLQVAAKVFVKARLVEINGDTFDAVTNFLSEAAKLCDIEHRSLTRMFGVCELSDDSLALVTELAPLRSLLECIREPALRPSFHPGVLCDAAQHIAEGMSYLENRQIVHRDLTARNILVFSSCFVKICDTGVSRAMGLGQEYYQANLSPSLKLPAAWCAPECVKRQVFTSASDVWSYGVLLWEIFTYGFQPWAGLTKQQILAAVDEPQLGRLNCPDACPAEHYALMLRCWSPEPSARPKFAELAAHLPKIIPERMTALRDCVDEDEGEGDDNGESDERFLHFSAGDCVLVLDKKVGEGLWRGIRLAGGGSGLFRPWLMKTQDLTQSAATTDSEARAKSTLKNRNRRHSHSAATLISDPQSFRHVGHVGINGAVFGDVGLLAEFNEAMTAANASRERRNDGATSPVDNGDELHLDLGNSLLDEMLNYWHTDCTKGEGDRSTIDPLDECPGETDAEAAAVDVPEARRPRVDSNVSSLVSSLADEVPVAAGPAGSANDRRRCSSLLAIPSTTGRLHFPQQQQQQQQQQKQQQQQSPVQKQTSNTENQGQQLQQQQKKYLQQQPSTLRSLRPKEAFRAPLGARPPPKPVRPLEPNGSPWGSAFNVSLDAPGVAAASSTPTQACTDDAWMEKPQNWNDYDTEGGEYDEIVNL